MDSEDLYTRGRCLQWRIVGLKLVLTYTSSSKEEMLIRPPSRQVTAVQCSAAALQNGTEIHCNVKSVVKLTKPKGYFRKCGYHDPLLIIILVKMF